MGMWNGYEILAFFKIINSFGV